MYENDFANQKAAQLGSGSAIRGPALNDPPPSFTGQLIDELNLLSQALYETAGTLASFSDRMLGSQPSTGDTSGGLGIAKMPCATVDIMERAVSLVSLARSNADLANRLNNRI